MSGFRSVERTVTTETVLLPTGPSLEYALDGPPGAPVVCFVHGLGAAMHQFRSQSEYFAATYRVLRLSHRGHGGSGAPVSRDPDAYTPRVLADDVRALLAHLGINELHFVGNSLGGLVGFELLDLGQPRLLSLTTFGTTAELHSSKLRYWTLVGTIRLLGLLSGSKGLATLLEKTATRDPAVGKELKEMFLRARQDALSLITRNIADYDYTPVLRRAAIPLLLIRGELDKDINAALSSTLAALAGLPHARVVPMAGAGHFANMEQPSEFNRILESFLSEIDD